MVGVGRGVGVIGTKTSTDSPGGTVVMAVSSYVTKKYRLTPRITVRTPATGK
jgi:hypothetical protein